MTTYQTGLKTALLLGGAWTDISAYMHDRTAPASLTTTTGRTDETTTISPVQVNGQINNRDFRFTSRNPTGPYYGQLGRNTPMRMSVPAAAGYLRLENDSASQCTTPSSAGLNITGDIDIRVDFLLTSYTGSVLACKWVPGSEQSWLMQVNPEGTITFFWSTTGSDFPSATLTGAVLPIGRYVLRVTLAVASGTVTFWTAAAGNADSGPFTQLGTAVVTGSTSVFASTASVSLGNYPPSVGSTIGINGQIFEFEVRNGIAGTVKGHPVFTAQSDGATSFADAQANTWTVQGTAEISGRAYIAHAEFSELPVAWDPSGRDIWLPFTAGGILRRLTQGNAPVQSPYRRAVLNISGSIAPVAYWPCEDAPGATQFGPSVGALPMTISEGSPPASLAADSTFLCSKPLPQVQSSTWNGVVPYTPSWTDNVVRFLYFAPAGITHNGTIASYQTSGTVAQVALVYDNGQGGNLEIVGFDVAGNTLFNSGLPVPGFGIDGQLCRISMNLKFNGAGSIDWELEVYQVGQSTAGTLNGTISGTIGAVKVVKVNPGSKAQTSQVIGHVTVQPVWDSLFDLENNTASDGTLTGPLRAWEGEQAGLRFRRLCNENGVAPRVYGWAKTTIPMGAQAIDTLPNLLQQIEDTDRGQLMEPPDSHSLGYRTLASQYNQAPAVTIDFSKAQAGDQEASPVSLISINDDQYTTNDWTVTNNNGATQQVQLADGSAMSVTPPQQGGAGDYTNTKTVYLFSDTQLPDAAGWLLHVSTNNEERYAQVRAGLHNPAIIAAALAPSILAARVGDFAEIVNPPAWLPPGPVKLLITGITHQLCGWLHQVSWNTVPESPYEIGIADDAVYGHADTDGSTLHANISSGATSMTVDTTNANSPLWTTAAGDFPFDIQLGGERITVTNITGSSNPQTFTITRSVNGVVKAQTAGSDVRLWSPMVLALV